MYMFIQGRLQQSAGVPRRHSGRETLDSCTWLMPFHPLPRKQKHPAPVSSTTPPVPSSLGTWSTAQSERRNPALGKSRD